MRPENAQALEEDVQGLRIPASLSGNYKKSKKEKGSILIKYTDKQDYTENGDVHFDILLISTQN